MWAKIGPNYDFTPQKDFKKPSGPIAQWRSDCVTDPLPRFIVGATAHGVWSLTATSLFRMRRSAPSVRSLSATASSSAANTMSFAPRYRGGGRRQWQRSFSDQRDNAGQGQSTAVNSNGQSVQDANLMSREAEAGDSSMGSQPAPSSGRRPYNQPFHPPPPYHQNHQYPQTESRPPFSRGRPHNQNQSFRFRHPSPPYNHNPQFAPPQQYSQSPRLYRPPQNWQNPQYPQQPMPYPNKSFHQTPPYYQNPAVGPPRQFQPRPPPGLNYRNWELAGTKLPPNCKRFVVLSYNILADYLALNHRSKLYYHIPHYMLEWGWRKRNIIFELGLWNADIMCFQEVDRFQDLEAELKLRGYNGVWKMRTGDPVDGCAIFWRSTRFKLLHEEFIEFNKLGLRDNVAQICVLELVGEDGSGVAASESSSSAGSNKIVVCNIHVLYNPKRGEIKIGQIKVLLDTAYAVSKNWDNAPVVLCGDFNCTPKSPLYNFISEQQLNLSGVDRDKVSGQASAEIREIRPYARNNQELPADKPIHDVQKLDNLDEHKNSSNNAEIVLTKDSLSGEHHEGARIDADSAVHITSDETISSSHASYEKTEQSSGSLERGGFPEDLSIIDNAQEKFSNNYSNIAEESQPDDTNVSSSPTAEDSSSNPIASNEDSAAVLVDEKLKVLALDESDEPTVEGGSLLEDDSEFLAALHDGEDTLPLEPSFEEERTPYDPSIWTPAEIATATGSEDCLVLEHKLKLKSTYTEIKDLSRTRDTNGEPLLTSYNRRFMGTVDYIWRSEGLQTIRVLAPIPKEAMQWVQGFPTKKWGSDHIALVSELAITTDATDQEAQVR